MANIIPIINNDRAPIHGSFVVSPDATNVGIEADNFKFRFEFMNSKGEPYGVSVDGTAFDSVIKITNAPPSFCAFDLEGGAIAGRPITLSLAIVTIGGERPHRVIHYTLSATSSDDKQDADASNQMSASNPT